MPGAWGRVAGVNGAPLPALKAAADVLRTMGTRVMRAGEEPARFAIWWSGLSATRGKIRRSIWGSNIVGTCWGRVCNDQICTETDKRGRERG
eukprot:3832506-Pleurochrysis_carterae.AAC.1